MIKLEINGLEFFVNSNLSVLEACKYVGITVPRFCYHETLSVAGNCRMCLVEISNSPKPVASCALPVLNNMKIFVDTPLVQKARENVLETLLLNHPLDCPICDQAGECDLQDQTKLFGSNYSRFFFAKRGVEDKICGPLIKTIMTRCIHCTRCVRFSTEISGSTILGTLNRGTSTEIGGYTQFNLDSEISGNLIDLCPVGALTSKSYAFRARPWELKSISSIDLTDSLGSNTYINFKETEIVRILPKVNSSINETLISDKARFSYDAQSRNRLTNTFYSTKKKLEFKKITKSIALEKSLNLSTTQLFLIDDTLDVQSIIKLKLLANLKPNLSVRTFNTNLGNQTNYGLTFDNNQVRDFKQNSKVGFLISTNPRLENTLLNTKLRIKFNNTNLKTYALGLTAKPTFLTQFVNVNINSILFLLKGKLNKLSKLLINELNPLILIGTSISIRNLDIDQLRHYLQKINPTSIILVLLNSSNSAFLKLSNIPRVSTDDLIKAETIYFINFKTNLETAKLLNKYHTKNLIWLNTHGSKLATKCHLILPLASYFECESIHVNLEFRPQKAYKVFEKLNDAFLLNDFLNVLLFEHKHIYFPNCTSTDYLLELIKKPNLFNGLQKIFSNWIIKDVRKSYRVSLYPIKSNLEDFYTDTKEAKNSLIMNNCSLNIRKNSINFLA